jgi:hypothetical protein
MAGQDFINRLAEAGLVDPAALSQEDRRVIDKLTEPEVDVLIQVATRLYPEDRGIVQLADLGRKTIRLCVPL